MQNVLKLISNETLVFYDTFWQNKFNCTEFEDYYPS